MYMHATICAEKYVVDPFGKLCCQRDIRSASGYNGEIGITPTQMEQPRDFDNYFDQRLELFLTNPS